jgi:hypothetical protein
MVTLAPGERLCEPGSQELLRRLTETFGVPVLHAQLDAALRERPQSRLTLVTKEECSVAVSGKSLARFNAYAEAVYNNHSHAWLDWYRSTLPARVRDAIELWRSRYGVTEEDQPISTAEKAYLRFRQKDRVLHRGGARFGTRYVRR